MDEGNKIGKESVIVGVNNFWMKDRFICNSLIFTPLCNNRQNVGADSLFCFISLPVPAAMLWRDGFVIL